MRTELYWILCFAASVTMAAALPSFAQEVETPPGGFGAGQQFERARADLMTALGAKRIQGQGGTGIGERDPAYAVQPSSGFGSNSQRQLFHNLYSGLPVATPYPGFDPELAQVNNVANQKVLELVKKIKEADREEVKLELKAEMKQVLDEQYDAYLNHHEAPLQQLESRLEKLRAEFESRKKAKDDLVKLRLDTIWYDAIGLGWPDNRRSASGFSNWRQPNQPAAPFASPTQLAPPSGMGTRSTSPKLDALPESPRTGTER